MTDDQPPHVKVDIARRDALVLELCDRLGFGFVMESASRQWSVRDPVGALRIERPENAATRYIPDHRHEGMEAIAAATVHLTRVSTRGRTIRARVDAAQTLEQIQAFVKAAGGRTITGVHGDVAARFAYDARRRTLVVEGLDFPLKDLDANHGRTYSNPYDEARTVHTLSLSDRAAGTEMTLALS